jgi:hypothetical protein
LHTLDTVGKKQYFWGMEIYEKISTEPFLTSIKDMISSEPNISRFELSRRICEQIQWRSDNGKLKEMSCRKALLELHRQGVLTLPENGTHYSFQQRKSKELSYILAEFSGSLSAFGEIVIEPISSRYSKDSKIWHALLDKFHDRGSGPLCGAQLRYIVKSNLRGYVGGLAFSSATWKLRARDSYIGWSESARRKNLKHILSNDRFLIVPTVEIPNLASYILSQVLLRLPSDWEERYSVRPYLVETYVDPSRFAGTCYQAANWKNIGKTSGRRDGIAKKVYLYPLARNWRKHLCQESEYKLGEGVCTPNPANWAEAEFSTIRLYDPRLKRRLYRIAQDFYNKPQSNIPEACGSRARSMGAYRFFQNENVTMEVILDAHTEATLKRIKEHRVVLAPQDTTILNYSTHPMTEGLGPIGTVRDDFIGLILHDTLAISEEGTPLGILDAQCWARDPEDQGKRKRRKETPLEQKESMKWLRSFRRVAEIQKLCPETTLVSIGDRESDIYDLFQEALNYRYAPKLLIRAERSRKRMVEHQGLWEYMQGQEVAGHLTIHIPRRGTTKGRDVGIDVRYADVELTPPKRLSSSSAVRAWAIYVKENSDDSEPIEWMLLTTAAVNSFADATERIEWYTKRWGVEVYHRTLKSGCRIEDRQLENADRLEVSLGIDMVVAWRIYYMTMLGREVPDAPCTVFFKDEEWKALHCYVYKTQEVPESPPQLREAIRMVGMIGGHMGRKSDGEPGTETLWRGIQRLDTATEMYIIFTDPDKSKTTDIPRDGP